MTQGGMAFCAVLVFAAVAVADIEIHLRPGTPGPYTPGEVVNVEAWFVDKDNGHPITGEDILFRGYQLDFTLTDATLGLPAQMNMENVSVFNVVYPDLPRPSLVYPGTQEIPPSMMTLQAGGEMLIGNLDVTVNGSGWLDVMNPEEDPNLGAWVRFGFGIDDDDPAILWRAFTGELTGGRLEMTVCQTMEDCNKNGVPDDCDLSHGTSVDCNENLIPDSCDVASGASEDCNENAIPDECEELCLVDEDCDDGDQCTVDTCDCGNPEAGGDGCVHEYQVQVYADICLPYDPPDGPQPSLDDILCILDDFADGGSVDGCDCDGFRNTTDLHPCPEDGGGDGFIGIDDVMLLLDVFGGREPCDDPCPE